MIYWLDIKVGIREFKRTEHVQYVLAKTIQIKKHLMRFVRFEISFKYLPSLRTTESSRITEKGSILKGMHIIEFAFRLFLHVSCNFANISWNFTEVKSLG